MDFSRLEEDPRFRALGSLVFLKLAIRQKTINYTKQVKITDLQGSTFANTWKHYKDTVFRCLLCEVSSKHAVSASCRCVNELPEGTWRMGCLERDGLPSANRSLSL